MQFKELHDNKKFCNIKNLGDTGDAKFKGYMYFSNGFSGWRGIYGSTGA